MIAFETSNPHPLASRLAAGIAIAMIVAIQASAQSAAYPKMSPLDQYLMPQQEEIAMARSAAPESVSKDAEVLVMDRHGYQTVVKGHNGFICAVQRSWSSDLESPDFWNP